MEYGDAIGTGGNNGDLEKLEMVEKSDVAL